MPRSLVAERSADLLCVCLNVFSVTEYNSMISLEESKAILPPEDNKSWKMWDNSTRYQVIVKFWIVQFWG